MDRFRSLHKMKMEMEKNLRRNYYGTVCNQNESAEGFGNP